MPYFGVDDNFHAHRKAIRAGLPAIGLWTLAGSWSNSQGTDGFVPDYVAARISPDYETLSARLVEVRLWEVAELGGEKGWQFHDWTGEEAATRRNYTRAETEQRRRDWANRQAKSRERKANQGPNVTRDNNVTSAVTPPDVTAVSRVSQGVPVPSPSPVPSPKYISSKPEVVDLGSSLTNQDQSNGSNRKLDDGLTEDERLRRRWQGTECPEHRSPSIANCYECGIEHRDRRYWTRHDYAARDAK